MLLFSICAYVMFGNTTPVPKFKELRSVTSADSTEILDYLGKYNILDDSTNYSEARNKLNEFWNKNRESIGDVSVKSNNERINILYEDLKNWATTYIRNKDEQVDVNTFIKSTLKWCDEWRNNTPDNPVCKGIGAINFNEFRYHLIYSFIVFQIKELSATSQIRNPPTSVPVTVTGLPPTPIESLKKEFTDLNTQFRQQKILVFSAIGISILLALLSLLYGFLNRRKIKKNLKKRTKSKVVRTPPTSNELKIQKQDDINTQLRSLENRIASLEKKTTSIPAQGESENIASWNKNKDDKSKANKYRNTTPPSLLPSVTYFVEQPNHHGIITKVYPSETNKSYFIIRLQDEDSKIGEITLIENDQKREKLFNTPDTYLPSSICDLQYTGQIDYSSRVRIDPGEVQKMSDDKWKVTKNMVVSLV